MKIRLLCIYIYAINKALRTRDMFRLVDDIAVVSAVNTKEFTILLNEMETGGTLY